MKGFAAPLPGERESDDSTVPRETPGINVRNNMANIWLKRASLGAVLAAAFCLIPSENAQAQVQGYQFGIGMGYGFPNSVRFVSPREDLPYFSKYPPVYYGNMVRRPYGVSPYAAPPGIMPAEFKVAAQAPCAQTIVNPHVKPKVHVVPVPESDAPAIEVELVAPPADAVVPPAPSPEDKTT